MEHGLQAVSQAGSGSPENNRHKVAVDSGSTNRQTATLVRDGGWSGSRATEWRLKSGSWIPGWSRVLDSVQARSKRVAAFLTPSWALLDDDVTDDHR